MGLALEGRMCCAPLFYPVTTNFDYFPGVPISGVEASWVNNQLLFRIQVPVNR